MDRRRICVALLCVLPLCCDALRTGRISGLRQRVPARTSSRLQSVATETGPPITALMQQYQTEVEQLRERCKDKLSVEEDDLFLLRFIIQNEGKNTLEDAATNLEETLQWRREKAEMLNSPTPPFSDKVAQYLGRDAGTFLAESTKDGCPLAIIRAGKIDAKQLMKAVSVDELVDWFLWNKEQAYRICDGETRATGMLTQQITANDLSDVGVRQDKDFGKALGTSSKLSTKYYPALQSTVVLLNLPLVAKLLFAFFRPLLPEAVLKKIKVCPGNTASGDIATCPFAMARLAVEQLPGFLAGKADK